MAEKYLIRTIPKTEIHAIQIRVEDEVLRGTKLEPVVADGEIKEDKDALKIVTAKYGKENQYAVTKKDVHYYQYRMKVSEFLANAEALGEVKKEEAEKTEETPA